MAGQRFPRDFASLEALHAYVAEFLAAHGIDPDHAFEIDLVIEELFTNQVKYHRESDREILVSLGWEPPLLTIVIVDEGVEPWDVTASAPVDVTRPVEERRAGGLGVHLVRRIAEDFRCDYDAAERRTTLTVTKRIPT